MIASKLSPGSIFPTLSTKSNPLGFDVSGTAMRTAHEPSAALTVTAYAVPSPSLRQRTSRRGRCNPHVTNRCAIDSRVTENSSFSWRRSGAGLVCQGHHTVTPANTADTAAHPTETQVATSTLAPMHSPSLKEAVMTHTTATTATAGKGGDGMSDRMMRRMLKVCAFVLFLSGIAMIPTGIVQRDWRMGLYGVLSLLFALGNVLRACIVSRPECPKPVVSVASVTQGDGADGTGHWVRIGTLKADTVQNGVIPDRSHHQGRYEILRIESFDGDVKAVQSFLNEHDAGYIAEVTPEQPIIVEALGNKACVYVTKIVQCELGDVLRLLEAK